MPAARNLRGDFAAVVSGVPRPPDSRDRALRHRAAADIYIRPLTDSLEKKKISLVIISQVGAGGIVGSSAVKRSDPDGYTLLFAGSGAMTSAPKFQKAEYTLDDFETSPISSAFPFILTVKKGRALHKDSRNSSPTPRPIPASSMSARRRRLHTASGDGNAREPGGLHLHACSVHRRRHRDRRPDGRPCRCVFGAPSSISPQIKSGELIGLGMSAKERFKPHAEIPTFTSRLPGRSRLLVRLLRTEGHAEGIVEKLNAAFQEAAKEPAYVVNMTKLYNGIDCSAPKPTARRCRPRARHSIRSSPSCRSLTKRFTA